MKMKPYIRKKISSTFLFNLLACVIILSFVLINQFWLHLSSTPILIFLTLVCFLFLSLSTWFTIHSFYHIQVQYTEPIEALQETLRDFKQTKHFDRKVVTNVEVDEIREILEDFSVLASDLTLYYKAIHNQAYIEHSISRFHKHMMSAMELREVYRLLKDVLNQTIPMDYGAILTIQKGSMHKEMEWINEESLSRRKLETAYSPLSECPSIRYTCKRSMDEVFEMDGCRGCLPVPENRQSSLCYSFSIEGNPYLMVYLGSRKAHTFTSDHEELLEQISSSTNLRVQQIQEQEDMERQIYYDDLTQLRNKRYIDKLVQGLLDNQVHFSVILLDVDNFKKVNDLHGHLIGDYVLKEIASILREETFETNGIAGRVGGEELILILKEASLEETVLFAETIRKRIDEHAFSTDQDFPLHVTVSIGLSIYPKDGESYEDLFKKADDALYQAKHHGKNRVMLWK